MNIYPGSIGEKLPVGTVITIKLIYGYIAKLSEIAIKNSQNNVKTISVEFKDSIGQIIMVANKELTIKNSPGSPPIITNELPKDPITEIVIKIEELIEDSKNSTVILSIIGCFIEGKKSKY